MYRFSKRKQILSILIVFPFAALRVQGGDLKAPARVSYKAALERAITSDPNLLGFDAELEAAEGQVEQANLRPNPVITGEVENFLGTGPFRDEQGMELTLGITQLIETCGKRAKRTELGRTQRKLVEWDRELRIGVIASEVRAAFVDVLIAQETLRLREEQLELAERSEGETARLVQAARSAQVELTRAQLAVHQQHFELGRARRELIAARGRLSLFWGDSIETDYAVVGSLELEAQLPELSQLTALLPGSVSLARHDGHVRSREASLALEKAKASPDFEIFGGGRYFNEDGGESTFVVGVDIPWPLFDQNQGNIRTARARLRSVEYERTANHRELLASLTDAYFEITDGYEDAQSIQRALLPVAEKSLAEAEAGYERGQFTLLSVLESRAALFEIREAYLDALARYAVAQSRIEALTRPVTFK